MSPAEELAADFATRHPDEAARALAVVSSQEAGAYLARASEPVARGVLTAMGAVSAARSLKSLDPATVARVISPLAVPYAADVLAHLPASLRSAALEELTPALRPTLSRALHDRTDTVAARAELDVPAFAATASCAEVLASIAANPESDNGLVYVLDDDRKLLGSVPIGRVMAAPPEAVVGSLRRAQPPILRARAKPTATSLHEGWLQHEVLPVCDVHGRFVGTLRRNALVDRGPSGSSDPARGASGLEAVIAMGAAWWGGLATLADVMLEPAPSRAPLSEDEDDA